MLEEFAEVAKSLDYNEPKIPIVSNLSGELLTPEQATDPAYWVAHVREPVRFADADRDPRGPGRQHLPGAGPRRRAHRDGGTCLAEDRERGADPHPARGARGAEARSPPPSPTPTSPGPSSTGRRFYPGAKRVALPTYPFQRERYWLLGWRRRGRRSARPGSATPSTRCSAPRSRTPRARASLLTGRLSLATHPWLADHAVPAP